LHEIFSKGRQDRKVKARSLLCYWAVRELGMSLRDLARKFEMSAAGIGYAVERMSPFLDSMNSVENRITY